MQDINSSAAIWLFALVQLSGWTSGLLARFGSKSRHRAACHALFMLVLVVVGMFTSLAFFLGSACWLLSSATLACMILLAICDFDRHSRPATI
ncbi:MAG TPA: hypothetical protein VGI75_16090 [Pirellulales bacterium]|jgi:hypothetical protein